MTRRGPAPRRGRLLPDDAAGRAAAVASLRAGGIVAMPTDTVYGVGVALDAPDGLQRLFAAKDRPLDKAIVLLVADIEQAATVGVISPAARVLAGRFWPGGLTLVLAQVPGAALPTVLTAGTATIGVRIPDHECPRALARELGPLPVTSANLSGQPAANDAAEVAAQLGSRIDLILDGGPARSGVPSTVVDCSGEEPRVLRLGGIDSLAVTDAIHQGDSSPMTILQYLTRWVELVRPSLNALGKLHFGVSPDDGRNKPSAHLVVERDGDSVDLVIWASGEAEFGYGRPEHLIDEHHELDGVEDLRLLLRGFLSRLS